MKVKMIMMLAFLRASCAIRAFVRRSESPVASRPCELHP